jgi:hypothetical protein
MADLNDAFSTLDDFLLGIAEGIARAQEELSRSAAGPAGQQFVYHLPRVDFEMKMNMRVVEEEALDNRFRLLRPAGKAKHLLFKPVTAQESSSVLEIAAVVRGSFVAVPANNGLPPSRIQTSVTRVDTRHARVRVTAGNAAGEALSGVEVQFNVDREESVALNAASGVTMTVAADTRFDRGAVETDDDGVAEATLTLASGQQAGLLVLVIDALEQVDTVVYEVTT